MNYGKALLHSRSRWAEILRYAGGCACGLLLKIVLSTLFTKLGVSFALGYFFCHIAVLIEAFCFHYFLTFRRRFKSWRQLVKDILSYCAAVAFIKVLDYVLVVVAVRALRGWCIGAGASERTVMLFNAAVILLITVTIFALRYFLYRILFRKPDFDYYTGKLRSAAVVHAADPEIAANAASGGAVTALLADLLARGEIDGALVARMDWQCDDPPRGRAVIVRSRAELIAAQGSIYFDFPMLSGDTMEAIRAFPGRLAAVLLPCQAAALRKLCGRDPAIASKIHCVIGLFCGHTSQRELLLKVLAKAGLDRTEIVSYRFRRGAWRGRSHAVLRDGREDARPSAYYLLYQNLFILSARRCLSCCDHFAEQADISCGDIWSLKYRRADAKPSMVACRTEIGEAVLDHAVADGAVTADPVEQEELFRANSRSAVFHKAVAARARAFRRYGVEVKVPDGAAKPRWNELLAARIIASTACADPDRMLKKPRRILKLYLYIMKALTCF